MDGKAYAFIGWAVSQLREMFWLKIKKTMLVVYLRIVSVFRALMEYKRLDVGLRMSWSALAFIVLTNLMRHFLTKIKHLHAINPYF